LTTSVIELNVEKLTWSNVDFNTTVASKPTGNCNDSRKSGYGCMLNLNRKIWFLPSLDSDGRYSTDSNTDRIGIEFDGSAGRNYAAK
jgi:hypothetical protein